MSTSNHKLCHALEIAMKTNFTQTLSLIIGVKTNETVHTSIMSPDNTSELETIIGLKYNYH